MRVRRSFSGTCVGGNKKTPDACVVFEDKNVMRGVRSAQQFVRSWSVTMWCLCAYRVRCLLFSLALFSAPALSVGYG